MGGPAADAEPPRQSSSISSTPLPNHPQQDVRPKSGRLRHCSMSNRSPGTDEYVAKEKIKRMQQQQEADEACKRMLQQQIDEKKMEAQKKREERQAALKAKIDRQNKEREEKERVDRLLRQQKQLERDNAAIIALAEKKSSSDAEIQQMKEVLRQLTMQEEEEEMEVQLIEPEPPLGTVTANPLSGNNHRRKKSNKSSSAKDPSDGASASRNNNVNAAKGAFF